MGNKQNIIEELKKQFLEFINNKDFENALVCINKLIKLSPSNFEAYNNRGILYANLGRNEEAEKDYTKAIELNPKYFNAYNNKFILKLNLLKSGYKEEKLKNVIEYVNNDYLKQNRDYININIFEEFLFYIVNLKEEIKNYEENIFEFKKIYFELANNNLYRKILKLDDGTIKNNFFELYVISEEILYLSKFNLEKETKLAHYTSREAIINILRKKDNKLRLKNSIYVNDPEEGEIFKELIKFDYENKDENKNSRIEYNKNNVYINCFSTNIDEDSSLPMWVNYGNQAKGCAIIFNNNFFGINKGNLEYINSRDDKILDKSKKRDKGLSYVELYNVIYLEKNGKNEYEIEDEKIRAKVVEFEKTYKPIKDETEKLDDKQKNIINEILYDIIQYPSFLFKAKHFEYEQEVRIIKRFDINDENIKEDDKDVPELYVELDKPIICEEVILGAKCENKQAMATFLYNKGVKKVTQSKLKYK